MGMGFTSGGIAPLLGNLAVRVTAPRGLKNPPARNEVFGPEAKTDAQMTQFFILRHTDWILYPISELDPVSRAVCLECHQYSR